jgi:hypothetical protein
VDGLEQDYAGKLQVVRLDFNDPKNRPALRALRVQGHPTVVLIDRNGKTQAPLLGPQTDASLRPAIQALVQ